jgi:hypothetical protein
MIPELAEPELAGPHLPDPTPARKESNIAVPSPQVVPTPIAEPPALRRRPEALLGALEALRSDAPASPWATRVLGIIEELTTAPASSDGEAASLVAELETLAHEGLEAAVHVADAAQQSAWVRAARALDRRLPLWKLVVDRRLALELASDDESSVSNGALLQSLHEVAALTAASQEGAAWRSYLRLDDLAGLASVGGTAYADARRAAARDVLLRMAEPRLTSQQREFLAQAPLAALANDLRPWASGAVSLDALADLVEQYELSGSPADAQTLAELRLRLKWSNDPRLEALADDLNRDYRNANVRVALAAELFNRLIPPQEPAVVPVNDRIAGAVVRGRSRTETQVRVRLLPDTSVWRLGLEVEGVVQSQTRSDVGPARVRNASRMQYEARKLIMINRYGLHIWPAEAKTDGRNSLVGVESRFDAVPLVGSIVEDVVRRRHRESQATAIAQVKSKVSRQARERMDREADEKLLVLEQRFGQHVLEPLDRLMLAVEPVDMSTTADRAVMRVRMASSQQLGAHTPRPSAPSDSLASLQLHESALNNAIAGLELDGRRLTIGELHDLLRSKFTNRPEAPPADLPQRAIVEFAERDAVRVACRGDCIELTLRIVEMRKGRDRIRNVGVHAFFRPIVDGLEVKLVRDGTLQFEGAHLRSGPRLVLHSVFGKLLRRDQEIPVLAARIGDDPRLAGLMVTQLVVDDGWVALSVGPALPDRAAWRTRGAAR